MFLVEKKIFVGVIFVFGLLIWPSALAWGADFGLSSAKITYEVGETVPVKIYVASPGQASNAVSGVVSFSAGKLQVTALAKADSVVNMWVQEPSYYNAEGQVNFEGVILNPGYTGGSGLILTINFKARAPGQTKISFANGSILANDGAGTNILKKLGQISLTIVPVSTKAVTSVSAKLPVKTLTTATTSNLDLTPPEQLAIIEIESMNPKRARFSFSAEDRLSGIDYYQFSIDDLVVGRLPYGANVYETPDQTAGTHRLKILVADKAGNRVEETVNFEISQKDWFNLGLFTANNGGMIIIALMAGLFILLILFIIFLILLKSLRRLFALEKELKQVKTSAPEIEVPTLKPDQEELPPTAKIIFRGQAEATQAVVLLRNGQIVAETKPGADNIFEFALANLPAGLQHFALVAVEALGNPALTQDYPVMLSAGASITVSGVNIKRTVTNIIKKDINYLEPNV